MQVFKSLAPPRLARTSTLALALCGAAVLLATGCKPRGAPALPSGPVAVQTLTLQPETVRDSLALDGTVQPSQQAQLTARVPGVLQAIHFQDGMPVRKGQLLFSIERTSYEEQVNLNQARLLQAESEFERQRKLVQDNATSQASVDNAQSNLQQAQANLRLAQLNLEYTEVRAPFDGVMGRRAVDVGNLVGATGPSVLGTLMQLSPAYVTATVNEREALRLRSTYAGLQGRSAEEDPGLESQRHLAGAGRSRRHRRRGLHRPCGQCQHGQRAGAGALRQPRTSPAARLLRPPGDRPRPRPPGPGAEEELAAQRPGRQLRADPGRRAEGAAREPEGQPLGQRRARGGAGRPEGRRGPDRGRPHPREARAGGEGPGGPRQERP
jgi:biotin carboxyl carrier protein